MIPIAETALVLTLLFGSSAAGFWLRQTLSEHHFSRDTVDSMRLVIGMLITFAALVLGLLTTTVKARFDSQTDMLRGYAIQLIELDLRLREYGPETADARHQLRDYTAAAIASTWPREPKPAGNIDVIRSCASGQPIECTGLGKLLLNVDLTIEALTPTDAMHAHIADALRARMGNTMQTRWTLIETAYSTVSWPFLALLVFWLMIVFVMFGLSAPRNRVIYTTIFFCGLSIASALFLVLDFDTPYDGLLALPSQPLRDALVHMDAPN
ncbi:DUF4239 domain-containing protein [Acidisphaera sp. L21]|uniref:bestrophin-like domain n=1 Tax=Acidisphaera sp. L21 TaxID=1641851 RepID=UPI00131C4AF1|nr:DUF4239 domain-containing protein [Acidisphaera sp. L21]